MRQPNLAGFTAVFSLLFVLVPPLAEAQAPNAWINELHYTNDGSDEGEFVEVVVQNPGSFDLSELEVRLYRDTGTRYNTIGDVEGDFIEGNTSGSFTVYTWEPSSIQNGPGDGLALCFDGTAIQVLSYEGTFVGSDGDCADGISSTDIGVEEPPSTGVGNSLQLTGESAAYEGFSWTGPSADSPGSLNDGQTRLSSPLVIAEDGTGDFDSIQEGVAAAGHGYTLDVRSGTYAETVTVNAPDVRLEGPNVGTPGDGSRETEATVAGQVVISAPDVVFDGFDVSPPEVPNNTSKAEAIRVSNAPDDVIVRNNIVRDFEDGGNATNFFDVTAINAFGGTQNDPLSNVQIADNKVERIARDLGGAGAVGISIQGNIDGADVTGNVVENVGRERSAYALAIAVRSTGNHDVDPQGVSIVDNEVIDILPDPQSGFDGVGFEYEPEHAAHPVTVDANSFSNTTLQVEDKTLSFASGLNLDAIIADNTFDRAVTVREASGNVKNESGVQKIYSPISPAVETAATGEIVEAGDGTYEETVTVNKALTLQSASSPTVRAFDLAASNVTIDGFTITGGSTSAGSDVTVGIFVQSGTSGHAISNNELSGPGTGGQVRGLLTGTGSVTNTTITGNTISGWTSGIYLNSGAAEFDIEGNEIQNNTAGIGSEGPSHVSVASNLIKDNEQGFGAVNAGSEVSAEQNCITGNADQGLKNTGGETIAATDNYWGAPSGPSGNFPGGGDAAVGNVTVNFSPETVGACPSGDPTPDCNATTLSESVEEPENGDLGVVTSTFTNTDGLEEIEFTKLENFTVTAEPSGYTRSGDTWTANDPADPSSTAVFDLTQTAPGETSTYFAIAASTCPIEEDEQLEVNFDPIHELGPDVPAVLRFSGNYPNPFSDRTIVEFALPEQTDVTLSIYDTMGRKIATLVDGPERAGPHRISWNGQTDDGQTLASGVYLLRLEAGEQVFTHRATIVH